MNDQFFNNTPAQSPQAGQQGAPSDYYSIDGQNSGASQQGTPFRNSAAPYPPTSSSMPENGQNQSSPPSQFKGLFARPTSIAPELASRKYTDPLPPPANMPGYPQGPAPTNVTYAPPAIGASESPTQQMPFQTPMPGEISVPPGFGSGFSAPDVAQPWSAQSPAQTPYSVQEALEALETIPTPAQKPSWQNSPTQSPPWQNASTQSPPWQSSPAQNPFWESAPAENPSWDGAPAQNPPWQNAPAQNPPWQSPPTQSPPWQNAPAQNGFSAQGNSTLYPPKSLSGSGQRNTPPPLVATRLRAPKKRGLPMWSRVLIGVLVVFLVLGGSAYAYYQANYAKSLSSITNQQVVHHNAQGQVVTATPGSGDVLTGGRLNILLLGSDTDGKSAAPLAQTDIIVTIDPQTKYVGMLSIPRDLRLYAPKVGAVKLDEAFSYGWQMSTNADASYANAVGMSIDTIEQNFGIPINYSAWVGLDGFVKVIDTVGGIDVDVLHPMVDDVYPNDVSNQGGQAYDYKRLYIAPGPQHLDGIHALEYVRTRHSDSQADFGRSVRQQQILSQLKNKLTQINVNQLPTLVQDLNGHVKTDMQISDIPKLMNFARGIDPSKIHSLVLSAPYSVSAGTVLKGDTSTDYIPVCSQIVPQIQQMFDLGDKATCPTVGARYSFPQTATAPATSNQVATTVPAASSLAASIQPAQTTDSTAMTTATAWQMLGAANANSKQTPETMGQVNSMGIPALTNPATTEVHSLLDLMFMTVFESFDAART